MKKHTLLQRLLPLAMLAAMLLCHHKTKKPKFMLTLPLFMVLWAAGVYLFAVYF